VTHTVSVDQCRETTTETTTGPTDATGTADALGAADAAGGTAENTVIVNPPGTKPTIINPPTTAGTTPTNTITPTTETITVPTGATN
jgi:hypothetical protein